MLKLLVKGFIIGETLSLPYSFTSRALRRADPILRLNFDNNILGSNSSILLSALQAMQFSNPNNYLLYYARQLISSKEKLPKQLSESATKYLMTKTQSGSKAEEYNNNYSLISVLMLSMNEEIPLDLICDVVGMTNNRYDSKVICSIFVCFCRNVAEGHNIIHSLEMAKTTVAECFGNCSDAIHELNRVNKWLSAELISRDKSKIYSSSSLLDTVEAVLWCLLHSESFDECLLCSINLGGDCCAISAIACSVANLIYNDARFDEFVLTVNDYEQFNRCLTNILVAKVPPAKAKIQVGDHCYNLVCSNARYSRLVVNSVQIGDAITFSDNLVEHLIAGKLIMHSASGFNWLGEDGYKYRFKLITLEFFVNKLQDKFIYSDNILQNCLNDEQLSVYLKNKFPFC